MNHYEDRRQDGLNSLKRPCRPTGGPREAKKACERPTILLWPRPSTSSAPSPSRPRIRRSPARHPRAARIFALYGPRSEDPPYPPAPPTSAAASPASSPRPTPNPAPQPSRPRSPHHFTITGSELSPRSLSTTRPSASFADQSRRRLRLHTPFFLRFTAENTFPRVYSTTVSAAARSPTPTAPSLRAPPPTATATPSSTSSSSAAAPRLAVSRASRLRLR